MELLAKEDITITQKHKLLDFTTKKQGNQLMENKYGYRICYQKDNEKLKTYLSTNSYLCARWNIEWFEKSPPIDNNIILKDVKWYILPVKNYFEYSKLWRGCPFRDYLSDFLKRSKK